MMTSLLVVFCVCCDDRKVSLLLIEEKGSVLFLLSVCFYMNILALLHNIRPVNFYASNHTPYASNQKNLDFSLHFKFGVGFQNISSCLGLTPYDSYLATYDLLFLT